MILLDLHKYLEINDPQLEDINVQKLSVLRGTDFYHWDKPKDQQQDSFNGILGLPMKEGKSFPLFPYEELLYNELQKHKLVWIKKATGLGITEFMLRYMAWLCLKDDTYRGTQMCVITGPNIDLAKRLITRLKRLFLNLGVTFDTKDTTIILNGVTIDAYPSHHLNAMRSLTNPKLIFLDESDFFPVGQQQDARDVSERYIGKSQPHIVMVSTPNKPAGLFERIELEPENECIYKLLKLDYTYGLDKIYSLQEIEKAKASPSFEREYNLKYIGSIGNIFKDQWISLATSEQYEIKPNSHAEKVIGIDPGFGASAFGIIVAQLLDGKAQILYAEEFERPDFDDMIDLVFRLMGEYEIVENIYIDSSFPAFIKAMKKQIGPKEYPDTYQEVIDDFYRKLGKMTTMTLEEAFPTMTVVPISFQKEHKNMIQNVMKLMEGNYIRVHPKFDMLITAMRTASTTNNEYELDKEKTSHDDIFDAFRLAMKYFYQAS